MRLARYEQIPEDPDLSRQWNALVHAMEDPQVFYTYEWSLAVSRAYRSPAPMLFCAYRGDALVGVAALALDQAGKQATFLTQSTGDYCDFVSAPSDREELIALVLRELRSKGVRDFRFANLPADSVSARVLRTAARSSGYSVFDRPAYVCAQVELHTSEQREKILRSTRRNTKKAKNTSARMGGVQIDHTNSAKELTAEFSEFAAANVARFLGQGRISHLLRRERQEFIKALGQLLSAREWLVVSNLRLDRQSVAWHFGFRFAGTRFWYLPAFDTEVRNLHPGPGSYLLYEVLQEAAKDPQTTVVDLGLGDEGYKKQYAKGGRQTLYLVGSRSRISLGWEVFRYQTAKLIKKYPRVEEYVRSGARRISLVRARVHQRGIWDSMNSYARSLYGRFSREISFSFLEGTRNCVVSDMNLVPLSLRLLALAAIRFQDDETTIPYMLRSAARLRSTECQGFALLDAEGIPVHISWVIPFEGFRIAGLDEPLHEPAPHSVLLFDPWTAYPHQHARVAELRAAIAAYVRESGKRPWIFDQTRDLSDLERFGFVPRFSLVSTRKFLSGRTSAVEFRTGMPERVVGLHPAA